jgi:hypothetical protein
MLAVLRIQAGWAEPGCAVAGIGKFDQQADAIGKIPGPKRHQLLHRRRWAASPSCAPVVRDTRADGPRLDVGRHARRGPSRSASIPSYTIKFQSGG